MRIARHLIALLVVLAVPAFALAASAAPGEKPPGLADGKGAFIDIHRYDLGIYTLIVFGALFFILAKFAWGPFAEGMRKREQGLLDIRNQAAADRAAAEELRVKLDKELADMRATVRAEIDAARRDAETLRTTEREAGVKEAAAERERAKREIEAAKDVALNDIYKQAVELATLLSAKTLSRKISADDHTRLVDESLAELKQAAKTA
jgi:F-type H+-transporting ATPase subunit b